MAQSKSEIQISDITGALHPQTRQIGSIPLTHKLDRYLKTLPVISFGSTLAVSWVSTAGGFESGLLNGGPASLVWGFFLAGPGTAMIVLSFAEMSSVAPSVGAQYRWAAIYCPSFLPRRFVSFLQGWLTVFAWIATATLVPFFVGSQILGLVILKYPAFADELQGWHITLTAYAVTAIPLLFNIFARKTLKAIEIIGAIMILVIFIVFVVVLVALGGRNSARYVFFADSGGVSGWQNPFIQWRIGLLSVVFPILGCDGVIHLSDEIEDPENRIPRTMVISWVFNLITAFFFMLILLFFMGDPSNALNTPTGWPIIEFCHQATGEVDGTIALMSMFICLGIISYFNNMVSVSRLTWAFARDDGLPFSNYFKRVHPRLRMPLRALRLTTLVTMLLLLIPIGSATAFNAVLSFSTLAVAVSYTLPCLFIFLRRVNGEHIKTGKWSLGRWGAWVNGAAVIWGIFISIWLCFPSELPVTAANMNWAGPIVGIVILFSFADWTVRGRRSFAVQSDVGEDSKEDYGMRTREPV